MCAGLACTLGPRSGAGSVPTSRRGARENKSRRASSSETAGNDAEPNTARHLERQADDRRKLRVRAPCRNSTCVSGSRVPPRFGCDMSFGDGANPKGTGMSSVFSPAYTSRTGSSCCVPCLRCCRPSLMHACKPWGRVLYRPCEPLPLTPCGQK